MNEVVLVTGHRREEIAGVFPDVAKKHELKIREIVNERFEEGSVLSLFVSLPEVVNSVDPVVLMDADVLYPAQVLKRLIHSPHGTALLIDRDFSSADDDPVLVPVRNGRPFDFRKQWAGDAELLGESIGFFKIAPGDLLMLANETRSRSFGSHCQDSYDDVLRAMVLAGVFGYEDVTGMPWIEIDFPADIVRARDEVMPAIERLT